MQWGAEPVTCQQVMWGEQSTRAENVGPTLELGGGSWLLLAAPSCSPPCHPLCSLSTPPLRLPHTEHTAIVYGYMHANERPDLDDEEMQVSRRQWGDPASRAWRRRGGEEWDAHSYRG